MSCNGCRVLRKGCTEGCILRACLQWIDGAEAQGHATLFVAKFFGRADLLSFISAVPHHQRPALFQSLLFEACGRTVNPVNGAVGLLSSGNWNLCQAAVDTVLRGGLLRPFTPELLSRALGAPPPPLDITNYSQLPYHLNIINGCPAVGPSTVLRVQQSQGTETTFLGSEMSDLTTSFDNSCVENKRKLLNLFV